MTNDDKVTLKDNKTKTRLKPQSMSKAAWILLLVGFIAFIFSSGRWNIFVTAWIWPCAFLYFSHRTSSVRQFMILVAALVTGHVVKWLNVLDAGYVIDAVLCIRSYYYCGRNSIKEKDKINYRAAFMKNRNKSCMLKNVAKPVVLWSAYSCCRFCTS